MVTVHTDDATILIEAVTAHIEYATSPIAHVTSHIEAVKHTKRM